MLLDENSRTWEGHYINRIGLFIACFYLLTDSAGLLSEKSLITLGSKLIANVKS